MRSNNKKKSLVVYIFNFLLVSLPALLLGFTVRSLISSIFLATWVDIGRYAVAKVFVAVIANLDSALVFFFSY